MESDAEDAEGSDDEELEENTPAPHDHGRRSPILPQSSPDTSRALGPSDGHDEAPEDTRAQDTDAVTPPTHMNGVEQASRSTETAAPSGATSDVDDPSNVNAHPQTAKDQEDLRASAVRAASEALAILSRDRPSDLPSAVDSSA